MGKTQHDGMVAHEGCGTDISMMESGALLNRFARCNPINN
jgi:hypothetical protein